MPKDTIGLSGSDKRQAALRDDDDASETLPEGLRRKRKHPLSPTRGREQGIVQDDRGQDEPIRR